MLNDKFYEIHTLIGLTFKFKLDENPITKEFEPHIWHRHQITPEEAVLAYLNKTHNEWNTKYQRYECYFEEEDMHVYFMYLSKDKNKIMVITAFKT